MSAEVKPGYKRTEAGVIPEDWDCLQISEIFQFKQGIQCPIENQTKSETPSNKRFIRIIDVTDGHQPPRFIDDPGANHHICKDDIFMVRYGSPGLICHGYEGVIANNLFRLIPKKSISNNFYFHYFGSIEQNIKEISGSSTMPAISFKTLGSLSIVLPSLLDQKIIAVVLSDIDSLISSLDQLIAKKRHIQQAAMQQLLTGQRRLPGFSGEWEVKRLGDVASLNRINVIPSATPDKTFTHFSLPAFDEGKRPVKESGATIGSNKFSVPIDAILVSKLNPRIPRVWLPKNIPTNAVASTEFLVLTPRDGVVREFLYVTCKSSSFCAQMELSATGTTGSHQRISPTSTLGLLVNVPSDNSEQTAIATILSEMDTELAALEDRRDKNHQLKQGMMQELLTGRVRLA